MTPETLQAMREQLDRLKLSGMESTMRYKELQLRIDRAERELKTKEGE